ncbi:MAG: hypothetical protein M3431_04995, partial [Actinomycetota bacterium]|nr:hypothetical protein [Actinomycetota bacterium]
MPEVLEVELTRRGVEHLVGRTVAAIDVSDPLVVQDGVDAMLAGSTITGFDRRGKQLVVLTDGPTIGVHLGMTGRILVDDLSAIGGLVYGSHTDGSQWDRWVVRLHDDTTVRLHDPRRFGRVVLDPDLTRLGPDVLSLSRYQLTVALTGRSAPLKAVLIDQHV